MRRIGGSMNLEALLGRDRHRPRDREAVRAAAAELQQRGLTPRDIATALELTEPAVRQLLTEGMP